MSKKTKMYAALFALDARFQDSTESEFPRSKYWSESVKIINQFFTRSEEDNKLLKFWVEDMPENFKKQITVI